MSEVELKLTAGREGFFTINDGHERIGEMEISIDNGVLTVYHTEVAPEAQGQGIARLLLEAMVSYARENNLKVKPLCPYVHAQFKRHPEAYADIIN